MKKQQESMTWQQEAPTKQPPYLFTLLRTKLDIPPVHPMSISRARLLTQLNKNREFKVTLISAPTGFGKTTLLSAWASQSPLAIAWISLSESDNDPAHFWAYFISALAGLSKNTALRSAELFALDSPEIIVAAVNDLVTTIPQEFVLVLDDYHTIQNQQIHTALTTLLKYLPKPMHICVASRTRPALPLARLRANRQLYELNPTDLLFTLEEIETFFTRTLGGELSQAQAVTIKTRTDGWIAIVQLVATWLQEQNDVEQALARIPDNHHYILDYLATEVLRQQPQATQLFLLQTSILEQFNASLCDAITGQMDAQDMLEQIEQANLFIRPLDNQQCWYSYHQIFRTFLRERLELVLPDLVPILYRRACVWYEQQKRPEAAIEYAMAGQDFERAAEIILKIGEKMLAGGEVNTVLGWLEALPDELICLYPLLCLFYAWGLMVAGQFDRAETWIRNIDYLAKKASFIPDVPMRPLPARQKNALAYAQSESAIAVLRAHIAIFWGDISNVADFTLQAQTSLSNANVFIQSLNALNIGVVHWLNGKIHLAEKAFSTAAVDGKQLNNSYIMLAADCGLVLIHMMLGKRRRAFAIAQQALQVIEHHKSYLSPFSAYLYTEVSYLFYEWNRLDEATHYGQEALAYGAKQNLDILIYGYIILSRIALARGELDEAQKLLQQAEDSMPYSQRRPWIVSRMAEHHVDLALARKDIRLAEYWSQLPELKQFGSLAIILPTRVLLAKNQLCEALSLTRTCLPEEGGELMPLILQAHAHWELGEVAQASQALDRVLHLAEPEGYIRFFLEEGISFSHLLRYQLERYQKQEESSQARFIQYLCLLLDEFTKEVASSAVPPEGPGDSPVTREIVSSLSERELDVLRGITAGLSNQEIAQQIVLAESTVKWHVKNIYSKLQVHNRAQAIIEARRLRLWP